MTARDTFIYRNYDANGELLYVGVTNNLSRRRRGHKASSSWFPLVANSVVAGPYPRATALALERQAQIHERPQYGDTPERRSLRATHTHAARRRLVELMTAGVPSTQAVEEALRHADQLVARHVSPVVTSIHQSGSAA